MLMLMVIDKWMDGWMSCKVREGLSWVSGEWVERVEGVKGITALTLALAD
jgi:hypothetical protein